MFDLGSAPPTQLLFLMAIPLGAAVLLAGFIAFSFINRSKKAKMKHGISESSATSGLDAIFSNDTAAPISPDAPRAPAAASLPPAVVSPPEPVVASESNDLELNMDILSGTLAKTTPNRKVTPMNAIPEQPANHNQLQEHTLPAEAVTSSRNEPVELMRFLRDAETGQLIIQIGSHRYTKLADISDKQIGQFILKMAAHLLAFTNGMIITAEGVKSVLSPKVGPAPQPVVDAPERPSAESATPLPAQPQSGNLLVPPPSVEAAAAFQAIQAQAAVRPAPPPPEPPPVPARGGLLGRAAPAPVSIPGLNLAKEINEVVQTRLTYSPLSATHRIDVRSSPDGGIQILVNGQLYGSPDEIAEPEVKTLIKDSIRQWERS